MLSSMSTRLLLLAAVTLAVAVAAPVAASAASHSPSQAHKGKAHSHHHSKSSGRVHAKGKGHKGVKRGVPVLSETLAPSMPEDPSIDGVAAGKVPWMLTKGSVRLKADGKMMLEVEGLVIPETGKTGPVKTVSASLYCASASGSSEAVATTQAVPLSAAGDARIFSKSLKIPSTCLAPVVLLHPNGQMEAYIAASGWKM